MNNFLCFAKGTQVLLSDYRTKNIEEITIYDKILTFNSGDGSVSSVAVDKIAESMHDIVNKIHFSNGISLVSTTDHPYYIVDKGWCSFSPKMTFENYGLKVAELEEEDKCLYFHNGKLIEVQIIEIETYSEVQEMYVIAGGNYNSFFANGIVVSDENIKNLNLEEFNVEYSSSLTV